MVDLTTLYPPFRAKIDQLVANCKARGCEYKVTSALRSVEEQDKLYALGRTVKNPDGATPAKPLGNIVTKAKGTQSMHNFSVAADLVQIVNGKADWSEKAFKVLGEEAAKLGLEWGGGWPSFVDLPHVQMKVKLGFLQAAYSKGKMPEVFKYLDAVK
jgi:peptidoglycan L-alanyl-D-glutamate endopeptidase CwlK